MSRGLFASRLREVALAILAAAGVQHALAWSVDYSAPAIAARVVDAETRQPLPGVHVVADWQLEGGLEGGNLLGAVAVLESITDADGRFEFPAWGPKAVERTWGVRGNARLKGRSPGLILFKDGYEYRELQNRAGPSGVGTHPSSDWNGKTIELKAARGPRSQYARSLEWLSGSLLAYTASDRSCDWGKPCAVACQWEAIPRMIRAIGDAAKSLGPDRVQAINIEQELIAGDAAYRRLGCASPAAVLGRR